MFGTTSAAALIPLSSGALTVLARGIGARQTAVALAAVAAAAQHDLLATASAQEQATYGIDQGHSLRRLAADVQFAANRPAVIVAATNSVVGPTRRLAPAWPPCRAARLAQALQLADRSAQDQIRHLTSE